MSLHPKVLKWIIFLTIISGYRKYYIKHVVERPRIHHHLKMLKLIRHMPSLHRFIRWTAWGFGAHVQFVMYALSNIKDYFISKDLYITQVVHCRNKQKLTLAWGKPPTDPKGILLIFHTLYGSYMESAGFAKKMQQQLQLIPVSYSRRGYFSPLTVPEFNSVGHKEDLLVVLECIKDKYSALPIFALGSSAGTSLLAQYLGEFGLASSIKAAVLISPGYDFEESLRRMPLIPSRITVEIAKQYFLYPHYSILKNKDKQSLRALTKATTMKEWHDHQWKFAGAYSSRMDYFMDHNPAHTLHNIQHPTLFISAFDDIVFPRELVEKYKDLIHLSPNIIIAHTNRGSHLGFYEGWNPKSWSLTVAEEFFAAVLCGGSPN